MIRTKTIMAGLFFAFVPFALPGLPTHSFAQDTPGAVVPVLAEFTPIMPSPLPVSSQERRVSERLVIGIDISEGSPFLSDEAFTRKTAARIGDRIERLPRGALVSLRSFGAHSTMDTSLELDRSIGRGRSGAQASMFLRAIIAGMPTLVESGRIKAQAESNIIGFLQTVSRRIDCANERTVVLIATDGLEDSEFGKFATDDRLPAPETPLFEGCTRLEMLGLGRGGGSARLTARLIEAWDAWGQAAGFRTVILLDNW
ncbi:MAG: hypothetical protein ACFB6R_16880 [Alphaproteobacteria bacterium]